MDKKNKRNSTTVWIVYPKYINTRIHMTPSVNYVIKIK